MSGFIVPAVTFVAASLLLVSAVAVMAADDPPPPKSAGPAAPSGGAASQPPMITKNPDGTFTVQKVPRKGFKDNNEGLVIPPQIVVPFILLPTAEKKHDATSLR